MLHPDEIARLKEAAAADPSQTVRLCDMLVAAGQAEEAVKLSRQALKHRPDDVELRLALGRALSAAGNLEEAQAALFDAVVRKRRNTRPNIPVMGNTPPPGAGNTPSPVRTPPVRPETPLPRPEIGAGHDPAAPLPMPLTGTSRQAVPQPISGNEGSRGIAVPPPLPPSITSRHVLPQRPQTQTAAPRRPASAAPDAVPAPVSTGGTSRHHLTPRPVTGALRPVSSSGHTPPPEPRKLQPVGPPSRIPLAPLPVRPTLAEDDAERLREPVPVEDIIPPELTGQVAGHAPAPAAPAERPRSGIHPQVPRPSGIFQPPPQNPLPAELEEPLPLSVLPPPPVPVEGDEPSLAASVLAAAAEEGAPPAEPAPKAAAPAGPPAASAPGGHAPRQRLISRAIQAVPIIPIPPAPSVPIRIDEPERSEANRAALVHVPRPQAELVGPPRSPGLSGSAGPGSGLGDIAARLRGRKGEIPPPSITRDRIEVAFERQRARVFTGLWISLGLVFMGVLIGWATRTLTTRSALQRRLAEAERRAAGGRYEDARAVRDRYQDALRLAPTDVRTAALLAEAEARLCADHGEGTEDSAFIRLRQAEREAQRRRVSPEVSGALRRAAMLLHLSRGEPCPTLPEAERARSVHPDGDGDVAARCALQAGDVAGALHILTQPGARSRTVPSLLTRGALALSLGDLEEADHAYRTVLDLVPDHPRAVLGRAQVLFERGQDPGLSPPPEGARLGLVTESWWHLMRGLSALRRGDDPTGQAAQAVDLAQAGWRYDARLALAVARARLSQGRVAEAEAGLRMAHRLSPRDPDLIVLDAEVALAKGAEDRVAHALLPLASAPGRPPNPRLLSVLGRAQYLLGSFREAEATLQKALLARPGDVVSASYLALCKARLGAERDAFKELEALAQGPLASTTPHYALAVLAYERKDLARAAAEAGQALLRNPEAARARTLLGRVLREQGDLGAAIEQLRRVEREAPALVAAHQILGRIYLDLGRLRDARLALRQVVRGRFATVEDWLTLAEVELALGLVVEGQESIEAARQAGASPGKVARAALLAESFQGVEKAQVAARALDTERRESGRDLLLSLNASQAWLRAGDPQAALQPLDALRGRAPLVAALWSGRIHLRQRNVAEAEAAYRAAVAAWDKGPYALEQRGEAHAGLCRALFLRGALDEAVAEGKLAVVDAPQGADGHYCLGRVLAEQGQLPQALGAAERAASLDPGSMEACVLLGDLTAKVPQGRDKARRRYERCLALSPNSPLGRYVRGALGALK
jgi:tetratricopeptide (TPR) repeat protein